MSDGWWNEPEWSNPVREKLKACGSMTGISQKACIYQPEKVSIGRGCRIDDFVHILGGDGIEIGDRVHISPFVSVEGGGKLVMGSYSGLAAGARIVTGSEDIGEPCLTNPCCPPEYRKLQHGVVTIGKHCLVFTGAIVLPGVTMGEGSIVAAGCTLRHDLPEWEIYMGLRHTKLRKWYSSIADIEKDCVERHGF